MNETPLWLSHHHPRDHHRCVRLGRWAVCARCLGTYPVMFALIAAQIAARARLAWSLDWALAFVLPLPALLDWARGRFDSKSGTNALRLATGALLGVGLGRTIYLHLVRPGHPLAMAQLLGLAVVAAAVELLARRRR